MRKDRQTTPTWLAWVVYISCFALGGLLGLNAKFDRGQAYDRGYADAMQKCDGPSRLERAAGWLAK